MIHVVFDRRGERLAVFGPDGHLWHVADASGDARGVGGRPPYGPGYPIPPGHYLLLGHVEHEPATAADGPGAIGVGDLEPTTLRRLIDAGRARLRGGEVEIARLVGPVGGLAQHGRAEIAIRGGGAALAHRTPPEDPLAPYQPLTRSDGGVRVHNADLARLLMILQPALAQTPPATVVFTVLGDPARRAP